jgi:hypothetical protein
VNTGERLASLSSLPSGSAMAHLLALQAGTGAGDSFYSGTVRVVTSKSGVSVQHKAKRPAVEREGTVRSIPERQKKAAQYRYRLPYCLHETLRTVSPNKRKCSSLRE